MRVSIRFPNTETKVKILMHLKWKIYFSILMVVNFKINMVILSVGEHSSLHAEYIRRYFNSRLACCSYYRRICCVNEIHFFLCCVEWALVVRFTQFYWMTLQRHCLVCSKFDSCASMAFSVRCCFSVNFFALVLPHWRALMEFFFLSSSAIRCLLPFLTCAPDDVAGCTVVNLFIFWCCCIMNDISLCYV